MKSDDPEASPSPANPEKEPPDKTWKASVAVIAVGIIVCLVGAPMASQKDQELAQWGERIHWTGKVITFVGSVGFFLWLRRKNRIQPMNGRRVEPPN
jgi:hypothetical protein